jgi:6-pyruvoyltetrahydropterin/6-carboxytetrahydropterin synthase
VHGYGRTVKIVFAADSLDAKGWVVDFGGLRGFKSWLEGQWDHRTLISSEDPHLELFYELHEKKIIDLNVMDATKGHGPGIEQSCKFIFDYLNPLIEQQSNGRCWVHSIEIWEHENNSAIYINEK